MKFLKHFIFGADADDFRKGKVFFGIDYFDGLSEDERLDKQIQEVLGKIDKVKNALSGTECLTKEELLYWVQDFRVNEEMDAYDLENPDSEEVGAYRNKSEKIIGIKKRIQEQINTNKTAAGVEAAVSGKTDEIKGDEVVEKTTEELAKEKEVAEKSGAIDGEIKSKTANVLDGEKKEAPSKVDDVLAGEKNKQDGKTEDDVAKNDAKMAAAIKDSLSDHNEKREQQSLHDFKKHKDNISVFRKDLDKSKEKIDLKNLKIEGDYIEEIDELKTFSSQSYEGLLVLSEEMVKDEESAKIFVETKKLSDNLRTRVSGFKDQFEGLSEESDVRQRRHLSVVAQSDFKEFLRGFEVGGNISGDFEKQKKAAKNRMEVMFPKSTHDWIEDYWSDFEVALKEQRKYVKILKRYADEKLLLDDSNIWEVLQEKTDKVASFFDFDTKKNVDAKKGFLHESLDLEGKNLDQIKKGKDFLEKNKFWSDRAEFEKNFKSLQSGYNKTTKELEDCNNKLEKIALKWEDKLEDAKFQAKFGDSKDVIFNRIQQNKTEIEGRKRVLKNLGDKDFYELWIADYDSGGLKRVDSLNRISDFVEMQEYEDETNGHLEDMQKAIKSDAPDPNSRIEFSFVDLWNLFENYIEKRDSDWKSRSASATAKLGAEILDEDSIYQSKFAADANAEEDKEAKEFEDYFDGLSTGEIKAEMYAVTDPIKLRAAIDVLIRRADFFWRDKNLLKSFNRCAGRDVFSNIDNIIENIDDGEFMNRVYRVVSEMFDKAKANLWSGQYVAESMKKNGDADYGVEAHKIVEEPKNFRDAMNGAFSNFYKGNIGPVDKAYYLSFVRKALQRRKMNNGPDGDAALWYLIMGLSIGFFTEEDMAEISSDFKGGFPVVDFFTDSRSCKKDGWLVEPSIAEEEGLSERRWGIKDFVAWRKYLIGGKNFTGTPDDFDMTLQNSGRAERFKNFYYQNMVKSSNYGMTVTFLANNIDKADISDHSLWAPMLTETDIQTITTTKSAGEVKMSDIGWVDFMKGYNTGVEGMWTAILENDKKYGDSTAWLGERKIALEKIGSVMQAGISLNETLVGNCKLGSRTTTATLTTNSFKNGSPAMKERNQFNEVVYEFLDAADMRSSYGELFEGCYKADNSGGEDKYKRLNKMAEDLTTQSTGTAIFQNAERVENVMKKRFGGAKPI